MLRHFSQYYYRGTWFCLFYNDRIWILYMVVIEYTSIRFSNCWDKEAASKVTAATIWLSIKNLIIVTITFCGYEEYKVIFSDFREPIDKLGDHEVRRPGMWMLSPVLFLTSIYWCCYCQYRFSNSFLRSFHFEPDKLTNKSSGENNLNFAWSFTSLLHVHSKLQLLHL